MILYQKCWKFHNQQYFFACSLRWKLHFFARKNGRFWMKVDSKDPQYRHVDMEIRICLAFSVGWLGIWNVMPSYSSYAASTIAVPLIKGIQRVTFYPKWCSWHLFLQEFALFSQDLCGVHPCFIIPIQVFKVQISMPWICQKTGHCVYLHGSYPFSDLTSFEWRGLGEGGGIYFAIGSGCQVSRQTRWET